MHEYFEKAVAISEALRRKVLSLSGFESAFIFGVVIVASLAFLASYIHGLRNQRERKRRSLLEKELHRVEVLDDTGNRKTMTVVDAFRIRFPREIPPEKRTAAEDPIDTADGESERKVGGAKRA